jgi:hypothetical protein
MWYVYSAPVLWLCGVGVSKRRPRARCAQFLAYTCRVLLGVGHMLCLTSTYVVVTGRPCLIGGPVPAVSSQLSSRGVHLPCLVGVGAVLCIISTCVAVVELPYT